MGAFRVKKRRERDKARFIRIIGSYLLMVAVLFTIFGLTGGVKFKIGHVLIFCLFCIPLSIIYDYTVEKIGSGLGGLLSGWTSRSADAGEIHLVELEKARHSKRKGSCEESLGIINSVLAKAPDLPEALFLKAQVQWEGFGNLSAAKKNLQKVMQIVPLDDTLHRWASTLYDDIIAEEKRRMLTGGKGDMPGSPDN